MLYKIKVTGFKNKSTQHFEGWGGYYKLYKTHKRTIKNYYKLLKGIEKLKMKFSFLMQFIFKPFKQFYSYVSLSEGKIEKTYYNEKLIKIKPINCTKKTNFYLFGILFFKSFRKLTEAEINEIANKE